MNEVELEVARNYLLAIYGYVCNRCHRNLHILNSVVHVDHVNGNQYDHRLSNLQLLCASCNNLRKPEIKNNTLYDRPLNYEQSKSIESMKVYEWIDERLYKFQHVCLAEILSDASKYAGIKEITTRRRVNEELGTELGKYDLHNFKCDSPICNGTHLFQKGFKPEQLTETTTDTPARYIIKINEDRKPRDQLDTILDKITLTSNLNTPLSTEIEAFNSFKITDHVNELFENLKTDARKYR